MKHDKIIRPNHIHDILAMFLTSFTSQRDVRHTYVVGSKSFRPDIQKPRQMENAVRDI